MQLKKQITYLKNNNIKYFKLFNIIISLPTTSIHYENLYTKNTKQIEFTTPFKKHSYILILITKF
jgi:hypothetical protein